MSMFKLKPIYEYLGSNESVFNKRITDRCGVFGIEAQTGTGGDGDGNPTGPIGTIPEDFGDPVEVPFDYPPIATDCIILTETKYVVIAVVDTGTPNWVQANVVNLEDDDTTSTVPVPQPTPQTLDSSITDWRNLAVAELAEDKFIVYVFRDPSGSDEIYGIVCTIDDSDVITASSPQLVSSDHYSLGVMIRARAIDGERSILLWQSKTAYTTFNPARAVVVTVPEGSTTLSTGTVVRVSDYTAQEFDIDVNILDPTEFRIAGLLDSPAVDSNRTLSISGTTITTEPVSADLGVYTGSAYYQIADAGSEVWITAAQSTSSGTAIVAADQTVIDLTTTTDTETHPECDIEVIRTANSVRVFVIYGTSGASPDDYVEMEIFTYSGGTITNQKVHRFEEVLSNSLRISQNAFSATKSTFVYRDRTATPDVVKTAVFEAGTG